MEQQIRFCTTSDGVRIAYASTGQGPPFVFVPGWISHLEVDWEFPWLRRWWESLGRHFTVVRFDKRGSGLSDRGFAQYSVDAWVSDLEAVTGHLGLRELALEGVSEGGPVAITYAARHPQSVSKLILHGTFSGAEGRRPDLIDALVRLVQAEWGLGSETMTNLFMSDASPEMKAWFTRHQTEGTTREDAIAMLRALSGIDVSHLLPKIAAPTLVVHGKQDRAIPFEWARKLTSSIPNARLFPFEGGHVATDPDIQAHVTQAILEFLSDSAWQEAPVASPTGLATILFTDIQSSAALRQRLGDAKGQELIRTHDSIVRDALRFHQGREIKHTGDGIMCSFSTASSALEAAIAIQRAISAHVQEHPDPPLGVYVGLNAGEPIAEEKDLFGTSVDLAKRICDHAKPGQILVSDVVRQLAAGKGFLFSDCGETEMRGFEDPVRLYEVRWREDG